MCSCVQVLFHMSGKVLWVQLLFWMSVFETLIKPWKDPFWTLGLYSGVTHWALCSCSFASGWVAYLNNFHVPFRPLLSSSGFQKDSWLTTVRAPIPRTSKAQPLLLPFQKKSRRQSIEKRQKIKNFANDFWEKCGKIVKHKRFCSGLGLQSHTLQEVPSWHLFHQLLDMIRAY